MSIELPAHLNLDADTKALALSFLIRYDKNTRRVYAESLRMFFEWCAQHELHPIWEIKRVHIETWVRYLQEVRKNSASTVGTRFAALHGFFMIAVADDVLVKAPTMFAKRPKVHRYGRSRPFLNSVELRALIAAADQSERPTDAAAIRLMGTMGLRVSEALSIQIEDFQFVERGYRVLHLIGKGKKPAIIPIPPPTLSALERAAGERTEGFLLIRPLTNRSTSEQQMTRKAVSMALTRLCAEAKIERHITPHGLRHSYVTVGLDLGISMRDMQAAARHADPRTTMGYDQHRVSLDRHANHTISANLSL